MNLPTLYKKSGRGFQLWHISVQGSTITVCHGMVGGTIQTITDTIKAGKNVGRANATTAEQQAETEAESRHTKQLKKGYVLSMADAEAGLVDAVIAGGIEPMLAHKYKDHAAKINWPCFVQPKLDGIRCLAIVKDGQVTLWSRTRKRINSVPHIEAEIVKVFGNQDIILDGELFNKELEKDFEKIVSLVRKDEPGEGHELIQYHIYDAAMNETLEVRLSQLFAIPQSRVSCLREVPTVCVKNEDELNTWFETWTGEGYEGLMLRNAGSPYENKRSYHLQKMKGGEEDEFEIVGIEEARGKREGQATLILKTKDGKEFKAVPKGTDEYRRQLFSQGSELIGSLATVIYQNLTAFGVPRFPVCKAIRNYE